MVKQMFKKQLAYMDISLSGLESAAKRLSSADKCKELREIINLPENINEILKEDENGRR
jgi:hypothetical protein